MATTTTTGAEIMSLHDEIMNISIPRGKTDSWYDGFNDGITSAAELALKADTESFSYVDITTQGCDGWLNLFFGENVIALIDNKALADQMRKTIKKKPMA